MSWSIGEDIPLLIRKKERGVVRGEPVIHDCGRELVVTDNSPALWSYHSAFSGQMPSLQEVRQAVERDSIPVAMVLTSEMSARSRYKCYRVATSSPNSLGWKVCHKRKVALRGSGSIKHRRLTDLQAHFRDFLSPSNIFLVPKFLGGLGELPHFIEAVCRESHGL